MLRPEAIRNQEPDWDSQPPEWVCPDCQAPRPPVWLGREERWFVYEGPCEGCEARELGRQVLADTRQGLLRKYGLLDDIYGNMSFDSYIPDPAYPSQQQAKATAMAVVEQWRAGNWSAGIMLYSPLEYVGVGKTHLAIAMAREAVELYVPRSLTDADFAGTILTVWDMPSYIREIKDSYNEGGTREVQQSAVLPAVLIMDDIGAETVRALDWYQSLLYDILNHRWKAEKATVVTTNLDPDQLVARLGERNMSRLFALVGSPVEIRGKDYRLRR